MTVCIPELGTRFKLLEDWTFTVLNERRNSTFVELVMDLPKSLDRRFPLGAKLHETFYITGYEYVNGRRIKKVTLPHTVYRPTITALTHTLRAGTVLIVDRIYIRQGAKDFSSVTFKMQVDKMTRANNWRIARFFAHLAEVNTLNVEVIK